MVDEITVEEETSDASSEYAATHYLLFGLPEESVYGAAIDVSATKEYLGQLGFSGSSLTQAREGKGQASKYAGFQEQGECFCDFCGRILSGTEYDHLKDGRDRCSECSKTVVKGLENYEALFAQTREGMCEKFGIDLPSSIRIKVVSQAKLAKLQGSKFVPTRYFDARAIGLAINRGGSYSMLFENGSPKAALIATTAHELTHIWQYSHWNWAALQAKYGGRTLAVVEGMAKWAEIQYLYLLNETTLADAELEREVARDDIYGYGLRLFLNQYPLAKGICVEGTTPFMNLSEPLEL